MWILYLKENKDRFTSVLLSDQVFLPLVRVHMSHCCSAPVLVAKLYTQSRHLDLTRQIGTGSADYLNVLNGYSISGFSSACSKLT